MLDLSTKYLGLDLKNPIVAASSGLTNSIESIQELEANNAAAVVIKSIFEEEIQMEADHISSEMMKKHHMRESYDYIDHHLKGSKIAEYGDFIGRVKHAVKIPVIASVNCASIHEWSYFAKQIEDNGADALELNIFLSPTNMTRTSQETEDLYFRIIESVLKEVKIPLAVKISHYFTNLGQMVSKISETGVDGIVLFNRFFSPDFDMDNLNVISSHVLSHPGEIAMPLKWVSIMSGRVECDLAGSTGINSGSDVAKMMLAGAKVAQVASTLYKNSSRQLLNMLNELETWMTAHSFEKIEDFRGILAQAGSHSPEVYDRVQFMKFFSNRQD